MQCLYSVQGAFQCHEYPVQLEAFIQGFEKQSSLWSDIIKHPELTNTAVKAVMGLGAGLVGAGIYKTITGTSNAITNYALKSKFESALQFVRTNNKIVKNGNQAKVDSYANTLFSFAPHVASDPNILSSLLANAVRAASPLPTPLAADHNPLPA